MGRNSKCASHKILLVIVDDLDVRGCPVIPSKANLISIVNLDRMLPGAVGTKLLKAIAWWNAELVEPLDGFELKKLAARNGDEVPRACLARRFRWATVENILGSHVRERHPSRIAYNGIRYKTFRESTGSGFSQGRT